MKKIFSMLAGIILMVLAFAAPASASLDQNSNWGGGVDQTSGTTRVSGEFVIPTIASGCGSNARTPIFVGDGGYGVKTFTQLGITIGGPTIGVWYEVFDSAGHDTQVAEPFAVSTGDTIKIALAFTNSHTTLSFRWTDETKGTTLAVTLPGDSSKYYSGVSAEWITEKLSTLPLPHFAAIKFTSAWYGTETSATDAGPIDVDMQITNTNFVNLTTELFPTDTHGVNIYWQACI